MRLATLTFDAVDPIGLASFWGDLLRGEVVAGHDGDERLVRIPDSTTTMLFMPVARPTDGKNRCHPDLHTPDHDADVARATALGAMVLDEHRETSRWTILLDPEGNEFCIVERLG